MKTISKVKPSKKNPTFDEAKREFDTRMRDLRRQHGLSLRDVQRGCDIHPSVLCRAEAGMDVYLTTALRLAKFFETTVEELWSPVKKSETKGCGR